ncbi:MAG: putative peptidoglycan glycosyltransferase FtsW [Bacteroidota bacterium]
MSKILSKIKGDKVIWIIVLFLSVASILLVYSATGALAYKKQGGNTEYYLLRHFVILIAGLGLMFVTHLLKYTMYARLSRLLIVISIPLLFYTLFSGSQLNDASRWIVIPLLNITFQTSDLAKLALVIFLARILAVKQDEIKDFRKGFVPVVLVIALVVMLILPANLSTAMLLTLTCLIMMFIGRVSMKHILMLSGVAVVVFAIFLVILMNSSDQGRLGTWKKRIENFKDPDSDANYQANQAKIAIASGYPVGKGPGNSNQRNFLPHPYSDFIYAIIIEEYGLIGGFLVLIAYLILLYRAMRIATNSPGTFGAFLALGLSLMLVFQALINMSVAVNLLPVTGQPLPLVSMGGTSIWFTCISFGIILSVSKEVDKEDPSMLEYPKDSNANKNIENEKS